MTTLYALAETSQPGMPEAHQYIDDELYQGTEYLSRQIISNIQQGTNVTELVTTLLSYQNRDSGFGEFPGYDSTALDTAFALEALALAGESASHSLGLASSFLIDYQNSDGGWSDGTNDSHVYSTAMVLKALSQYQTIYNLSAIISEAQSFLLAQTTNHRWSEIYQSAFALIALIKTLDDVTPIADHLSALREQQQSDGSWNHDVYTTALVLRALQLAKTPPTNPGLASLIGTVIDGQTGLPLNAVDITLSGPSAKNTRTAHDGTFRLHDLIAGNYTLTISAIGYAPLTADTVANPGQTIDFGNIQLLSAGTATTGTIRGVITDTETGLPLQGVSVGLQHSTSVVTNSSGEYRITQVTPDSVTLTATLNGYSTATSMTDVLAGGLFLFSPALTAVTQQITAIQGEVMDGNSGLPLSGVEITLSGSTNAITTTDNNGQYQISNLNTGEIVIVASLSDYDRVTATTTVFDNNVLVFSPALYPVNTTPSGQNTTSVTGIVVDASTNQPLADVTIDAFFGATSTTIVTDTTGRFTLTDMTENQSSLNFSLNDYESRTATLTLQPLSTLDMGEVRLRPTSVQQLLPDLVVNAVDNTTTDNNPDSLELTGFITVDIGNIGTAVAPAGTDVIAFYDNDRNRHYDVDIDLLLGEAQTEAEINVDDNQLLDIQVQGRLPYRDALIHVWVDSTQSVIESSEVNNVSTSASQCGNEPTNIVTPPDGITVASSYSLEVYATGVTSQQGPTQLAIDSQDNLYFSLGSSGAAIKIPAGTGIPESFGDTGTSDPDGIAIDSQDNVIISGNPVLKFTPDGSLIWSKSCPSGNIQLADVDESDSIYVGSLGSSICKFSADGELEVFSSLPTPSAPNFAPDGLLYITQSPKNIYTVDPNTGEFLEIFLSNLSGAQLEFDRDGNIYTGYFNDPSGQPNVIKIDPITKVFTTLVTGLTFPTGYVFDSQGNLFISDQNTKIIYKLTPSQPGGIDLTASSLSVGTNTITTLIGNGGLSTSPADLVVALYEGDPAMGGTQVGTVVIPSIPADNAQLISFNDIGLTGGLDLYVVVDADNQVTECREDNNMSRLAAPDLKPDLIIADIDTTAVDTDLFSLNISGSLEVTIKNRGIISTQSGITILAYYDVDNSGDFDEAIDILLGQGDISNPVQISDNIIVEIPINGTLPFRDAPISVWVDSQNAILEFKEDNNIGITSDSCRINPEPLTPSDVSLAWRWSGINGLANQRHVVGPVLVGQLNDDNGDGKIDVLDIPDLVFSAGSNAGNATVTVLVALNGADGRELWHRGDLRAAQRGAGALGDIDNDGIIELVISNVQGNKLMALEHDGTLKWSITTKQGSRRGMADGLVIADLDSDGNPEIIQGREIYDNNGNLIWVGSKDQAAGGNNSWWGFVPIVADLDLNGKSEVIAGRTLYDSAGNIIWHRNDLVADGFNAVGNFDKDDFAEIILVAKGRVYLLEHTGETIWGPISLPGGGNRGGPPTVADFDGDGEPEIGIAGATKYTVLETDGTIKWTSPTQDTSSAATGSSLFDFEDDGKVEVLYADEKYFRIYNGETGEILVEIENGSVTSTEYPVVADIDNDGSAEIIIPANWKDPQPGIRVFESTTNSWSATRNIWNQHSYHINNINDDGTIPQIEQPSWLSHNTYRLNTFADRKPGLIADITASVLKIQHNDDNQSANISVRIANAGSGDLNTEIEIAFYQGDPENNGQLLGTVSMESLTQGSYQKIILENITSLSGTADIYVLADYDNRQPECKEANNQIVLPITSVSPTGQISITSDQPVYGPDSPVQLQASISNTSILPAEYQATLWVEDAQGILIQDFEINTTGSIDSGATRPFTEQWQTGQFQVGTYYLHGLLHSLSGELIHQASTTFEIQHAINGNPLATLRTSTDKAVYNTHDVAQLFNLVQNLASNQTISDANLQITVTNPSGTTVFTETVTIGTLVSEALKDFTTRYSFTQAIEGTYTVTAKILNSAGVSLATALAQFEVQANLQQLLLAEVSVQLAELERGQLQSCTDKVSNNGSQTLLAQPLRQLVVNLNDGQVQTSKDINIDLSSNAIQILQRNISTQGFDEGVHACIIQAKINGEWLSLSNATFTVTVPPIDIESELVSGTTGRLLVLLDGNEQGNGSVCHDDENEHEDDDDDDDKGKKAKSKKSDDDDDDHEEDDDHDDDDDESECDEDDSSDNDDDPYGSFNAPGLAQQQAYLQTLLTENQWSYTLVTDADAFTREFRTGTYTIYALFSEQEKLAEQVQQELREAVFRGDGLLLAGGHDHRHNKLDNTLGLNFKGKHSDAEGIDLLLSNFPLRGITPWSFDEKPLKVSNKGAETLAYYLGSKQAIAVSRHSFGEGRSLFAGFDLLAQASQDSADPLFGELILAGLQDIVPTFVDTRSRAPASINLKLNNQGISTPGQAIITVPENTTLLDTGAAQQETHNSLLWTFNLAEYASISLTFWIQLPPLADSIDINGLIQVGTTPELSDFSILGLTLPIDTTPTLLDVLDLPEIQAKAYKNIRKDIEKAQSKLEQGDYSKALKYAIKAANRFEKITEPNADSIRLHLDDAIRAIAQWL